MGVFCTDRTTGVVFGASGRVWDVMGQVLRALAAERAEELFVRDGYVPSAVARSWGEVLFDRLSEVVMVCRPMPEWGPGLWPVAVYRRGDPVSLRYSRAGEQLSAYDTDAIAPLLAFAQFCALSTGHTVTTVRPSAPGVPRSGVVARYWLHRTGMMG